MRSWTKAVTGVAVALMALLLPVLPANAGTVDDEYAFVTHINALRSSKGLAPLTVDAELTSIARQWAAKMAAAGKISHNPDYANQVTQNWQKLGENVGVGPDVGGLHDAFVRSPGHYANLVDPAFTRIGVGVVRDADGLIFTAHQFMALFQAAEPAPAPAAAPAPAPAPAPSTDAEPAPTRQSSAPVVPALRSSVPAVGSSPTDADAGPVDTEDTAPLPPAALTHALTGLRLLDAAA